MFDSPPHEILPKMRIMRVEVICQSILTVSRALHHRDLNVEHRQAERLDGRRQDDVLPARDRDVH